MGCGTFLKSGRVSCCAPDGAWYKHCGGVGNRNADHMWSEGVEVCKPAPSTAIRTACLKCGTIKKSGKTSCCGRGGSWFGNCGRDGNAKVVRTWYEGIQVCKARSHSKAAIGRQSNAAQRLNSSSGVGTGNPNAVTTSALAFT